MSLDVIIAAAVYEHVGTIKGTAKALGYSFYKTKKLLVSAGVIHTEEADMLREGLSVAEIAAVRRVSPSVVCGIPPTQKACTTPKSRL